MPGGLALALSLVGLATTLGVAVARPPRLPEGLVALGACAVLLATGALSVDRARLTVLGLAPTVGFLATLLLLAEGSRREGLFVGLGGVMARHAGNSPRRLMALVFVVASAVTATLGLDPTIVLLTPVVFATATRLRMSAKPHVYACSHLANSASLVLPISNLTNLLAFRASGLSFLHFATLMVLPTLGAIAVEWLVLTRYFASDLGRPHEAEQSGESPPVPRFPVAVLVATLLGFLLSSPLGVDPVWVGAVGAAAMSAPSVVRRAMSPAAVIKALEPNFLVFVLGLGLIVATASSNGLDALVRDVIPQGNGLGELVAIALASAVLANLVNNVPAILLLAPILAPAGPQAILAALLGVNIGPNLTYAGSLATLLWRRVLQAEDTEVSLREFVTLGAISVPAGLIVSTVLLWAPMRIGV